MMTGSSQVVAGFRHRPRLLVAGADENTRIVLFRRLASDWELCYCGSEAVFEVLAAGGFDGLILDLDCAPLAVGRLLGDARRQGIDLPARIVFLSGEAGSVAPCSVGEGAFLRKPLDERALRAALAPSGNACREPLGRLALATGIP